MANEFKKAFKNISSNLNKSVKKTRSAIAAEINKELTSARKEIVENLITKTGLKRKVLNDRLSITRANPKDDVLTGSITPLYGKRIYMTDYPTDTVTVRGGKKAIRLLSSIYRKNMRTGFFSKDGSRLYLRDSNDNVSSVKGRTVPTLFDQSKFKEAYESIINGRLLAAINRLFKIED